MPSVQTIMRRMQVLFQDILRSFQTLGVARNGLFAATQAVVTIICLFLTYRILISVAGLEGLGLWSLLVSFGGMALIADVSGASALARFVASRTRDKSEGALVKVIHTVMITSFVINFSLIALLASIAPILLPEFVAPSQQATALKLVPWVAIILILTPLSLGTMSAIDGFQRADQRAMLLASGAVFGLLLAWIAISHFGLLGIAIAQVAQQLLVIVAGWLLLRRKVPGLGWFPILWNFKLFKETTGYALKLNVIGVFGIFFEPLTKFLINMTGGTAAVGLYELAARLVMQTRNLVISATTPLVPAFATAADPKDPNFLTLLGKAQKFVMGSAFVVTLISVLASPLMSYVILGEISVEVLRTNAILAFGWSVNLLMLPLFLAGQGFGLLRWNILAQATLAVCVAVTGTTLMTQMGVTGVVIAVSFGLTIGALVGIIGNTWAFNVQKLALSLLPKQVICVAMISTICAAAWLAAPLFSADQ